MNIESVNEIDMINLLKIRDLTILERLSKTYSGVEYSPELQYSNEYEWRIYPHKDKDRCIKIELGSKEEDFELWFIHLYALNRRL